MPPRKAAVEPRASRPHMPGYGILRIEEGKGLLPWSWAAERLAGARTYWLATVRPDARPHAMPVWGVWLSGTFCFSTGKDSRKARNLASNRHCVVCIEHDGDAVVVEGVAEDIKGRPMLRRAMAAYEAKYGEAMDPALGPIYAVHPRVAFGFIGTPEDYTGSATRWRFGDG